MGCSLGRDLEGRAYKLKIQGEYKIFKNFAMVDAFFPQLMSKYRLSICDAHQWEVTHFCKRCMKYVCPTCFANCIFHELVSIEDFKEELAEIKVPLSDLNDFVSQDVYVVGMVLMELYKTYERVMYKILTENGICVDETLNFIGRMRLYSKALGRDKDFSGDSEYGGLFENSNDTQQDKELDTQKPLMIEGDMYVRISNLLALYKQLYISFRCIARKWKLTKGVEMTDRDSGVDGKGKEKGDTNNNNNNEGDDGDNGDNDDNDDSSSSSSTSSSDSFDSSSSDPMEGLFNTEVNPLSTPETECLAMLMVKYYYKYNPTIKSSETLLDFQDEFTPNILSKCVIELVNSKYNTDRNDTQQHTTNTNNKAKTNTRGASLVRTGIRGVELSSPIEIEVVDEKGNSINYETQRKVVEEELTQEGLLTSLGKGRSKTKTLNKLFTEVQKKSVSGISSNPDSRSTSSTSTHMPPSYTSPRDMGKTQSDTQVVTPTTPRSPASPATPQHLQLAEEGRQVMDKSYLLISPRGRIAFYSDEDRTLYIGSASGKGVNNTRVVPVRGSEGIRACAFINKRNSERSLSLSTTSDGLIIVCDHSVRKISSLSLLIRRPFLHICSKVTVAPSVSDDARWVGFDRQTVGESSRFKIVGRDHGLYQYNLKNNTLKQLYSHRHLDGIFDSCGGVKTRATVVLADLYSGMYAYELLQEGEMTKMRPICTLDPLDMSYVPSRLHPDNPRLGLFFGKNAATMQPLLIRGETKSAGGSQLLSGMACLTRVYQDIFVFLDKEKNRWKMIRIGVD